MGVCICVHVCILSIPVFESIRIRIYMIVKKPTLMRRRVLLILTEILSKSYEQRVRYRYPLYLCF